jgi:cell division protein ZapA
MLSKNNIQVIIAGKIYTLSGFESEEYLQRVAAYLNNKIIESGSADGYYRMSPELRSILLELNIADDYFKMKLKVEEMEHELSEKEKEMYDYKHELVAAQVRLEELEKQISEEKKKNAAPRKEMDHPEERHGKK